MTNFKEKIPNATLFNKRIGGLRRGTGEVRVCKSPLPCSFTLCPSIFWNLRAEVGGGTAGAALGKRVEFDKQVGDFEPGLPLQ